MWLRLVLLVVWIVLLIAINVRYVGEPSPLPLAITTLLAVASVPVLYRESFLPRRKPQPAPPGAPPAVPEPARELPGACAHLAPLEAALDAASIGWNAKYWVGDAARLDSACMLDAEAAIAQLGLDACVRPGTTEVGDRFDAYTLTYVECSACGCRIVGWGHKLFPERESTAVSE